MGRVQTAPVNNDANKEWGLYSVNDSGMQAGHTVVLTGPLEKPIAQKKKVIKKNQKMAQQPSGGRGMKKKVCEEITTCQDHAGSAEKNENESTDDDDQAANDDGKDKDTLPIVVVPEPMNSKF